MTVLIEGKEGQKNEILSIQNPAIAERFVFVNDISDVTSLEHFYAFFFLKTGGKEFHFNSHLNKPGTHKKYGANYLSGIFEWADKIGLSHIVEVFKKLSALNSRYEISPLLEKIVKQSVVINF